MTFEYKSRLRPESCDVKGCRGRNNLTFVDSLPRHANGRQVKLCAKCLAMVGEQPPAQDAPAPQSDHHAEVLAIVEPVRNEAEKNAHALSTIVITSQAMLENAGELLQETKAKFKQLESERTKVTKPLLDAKRQIDSWFDPAKSALRQLEATLKGAMSAYVTEQEQRRLEALQLGKHEEALATEQPVMPSGISTRTSWRFNVIDASKVPREYLVLDMAKIQAHVSVHKSNSSIPGIEAVPETGIAARASS